jgi:hypothetical protein
MYAKRKRSFLVREKAERFRKPKSFGIRHKVFETGYRLPTGEIPVYPKPVSRVEASQMGDSVRIAEKYLAGKYAGCVIEPRKAVSSCGRADAVRNDGRQHGYKQIDGYLYPATVVREQGMYTKGNLRNLGGLYCSPEKDGKVVITKTPGCISFHVHLC